MVTSAATFHISHQGVVYDVRIDMCQDVVVVSGEKTKRSYDRGDATPVDWWAKQFAEKFIDYESNVIS